MVASVKSSLAKVARQFSISGSSLALILACGGKEFSSEPAGSGGARGGGDTRGGSAGMSSGGSGDTTSGGSMSQAGDSGSSGTGGSASCSCEAGQYCRAGKCRDCDDPSVFEFGAPEALSALSGSEPSPGFPRSGGPDGALFYSTGYPNQGHIHFTPDFDSDPGVQVSGESAPPEFGPLFIEDRGGLDYNFLFSRTPQDTPSMIMTADWDPGTLMLTGIMPAPGSVNDDAADDYSVAFASGATRYWWMSNRGGTPELYTTPSDSMAQAQVVALELPGPCPAVYPDYTPWVTSDGGMLLFTAQSVDAQCVSDGASDLYFASLGPSGEPATQVFALDDVNQPGSNETSPSLSPDGCYLYFASNADGDYTIYRAPRR